jgi:ABC-2 type transport system permease protein
LSVPFIYLFRESLQLRKSLPWIVIALLGMLLTAIWHKLSPGTEITPNDRYVNVVNLLVYRTLPLASAIYTTMVLSQEVEQKTIVYLLTRSTPRAQLLIGRWLATVAAVVTVSVLGMGLCIAGAGGVTLPIWRDLMAVLLGAVAYGSLFLMVTMVFNRALMICVLFAFGWESTVPNLPTGIQQLSILSHMQAVAAHPDTLGGKKFLEAIAGIAGQNDLSPLSSALKLGIFSVVMVAVATYWFKTHEFIPREDAE